MTGGDKPKKPRKKPAPAPDSDATLKHSTGVGIAGAPEAPTERPSSSGVPVPVQATPSVSARVIASESAATFSEPVITIERTSSGPVANEAVPGQSEPVITIEPSTSGPIVASEVVPGLTEPVITVEPSTSGPVVASEVVPGLTEPVITIERGTSGPLVASEVVPAPVVAAEPARSAGEVATQEPVVAEPLVPLPPVLPTPAEAALEAARIVSEMVDIDSESGAVIVAAAAAGAAIEAAVAAQKAVTAAIDAMPASDGSGDPITTVKLSRDRILRALEDQPGAEVVPAAIVPTRARTDPGRVRARTEPGEADEEEFDPVAIAAAAIARLRQRARTDLAELRVHYHRHDVLVLLLALVMIVGSGRVWAHLVTPRNEPFAERGLTLEHPSGWLRTENVPMPPPRLVRDAVGGATSKDDALYHVELTVPQGTARIEVLIDKKPAWSNIVTGLELDRRTRWGELYRLDDSSVRSIAGHDWLRTEYRYAAQNGDVPQIDRAIEYATIDRDQIYVITLFGDPRELGQLEDIIAPSLRVQSQTGLPLVPQTSRVSQHTYPNPVSRAFDSTVMVVVADLVDGRLKARGGGSGVIVNGDGSILTNYHVIHDKDGRLHDVFVIGRFSAPDQAPQLQCAGRPNRGKLQRDLDLALIKCDMDLDGRAWNPKATGVWATLAEARAADVKMGQRLWVLGYPDVGGGGLTLSQGEVEGWTGEDGTAGTDFIKTDASITHGNSGGPVVDDQGRLVGVASAFRTKVTATGSVIETAQVGLVRPLKAASDLLAIASAGWTPREGHTDVELTPTAVEAAAEGVRIWTIVQDDANEQPIRDAAVMVLKPNVNTATIDMNRLDDQAIAWGKTNAMGEVRLKQLVPVPGTYTVMVLAPGYEPLISEGELHLDANTPPGFDPWGKIGLRSR